MPDRNNRPEPSAESLVRFGCLMGFAAFVAAWIIMLNRVPMGH